MSVVLLLAAAAIVLGAVLAALGRGGELAVFHADFPAVEGAGLSPAELLATRPPMSLWGYHAASVDETMDAVARAVAARDAQLAALRRELAALRAREALRRNASGQDVSGQDVSGQDVSGLGELGAAEVPGGPDID